MIDYFKPSPLPDWYGAVDNMEEKSGQNIPYGGWGYVQPTFGEVYGSEQAVPYGGQGRTQPVYSDFYGAGITETLTTANFVTGFLVGAIAVLAVGWYHRKKEMQPQ